MNAVMVLLVGASVTLAEAPPFSDYCQRLKLEIQGKKHGFLDIHLPLHVGRGADRGGKSIKVQRFEEETNLHTVWVDKMIDSTKLSFTEPSNFSDKASKKQIKIATTD